MGGNAKNRTTQFLPEKPAKIVGKVQPLIKAAGIGLFKFSCLVRPTRSGGVTGAVCESGSRYL